MKPSRHLVLALLLACTPLLHAAAPAGKPQQLTSPDQVPEGLAKSDWSSIRAAYEAGRHAAHRQENGTLTARNPGQQWRTEFDGKGFTTIPDVGGWTWGLELTGYGERTLMSASSPITQEGGKITCHRDENLTEWFINDTRGLEQGWTFQHRPERPEPTTPLRLHLSTRGDLRPQVSPDGSRVSFHEKSGGSALTYGGLKAWDTDGKKLLVRFEQAEGNRLRIAINEQSARYPITIDPVAQQAYLKASNTGAGDQFGGGSLNLSGGSTNFSGGSSVSVSGDTVVVGAPREDSNTTGVNGDETNNSAADSGAVYVFVRNGTTWSQQAYLKASNTQTNDFFGHSVAVSGDTVVVGKPGDNSSTTGVNSTPNGNSNPSNASGATYVFVRSGTSWSQQAYLKASNTGTNDQFGLSVAVAGDTMVVGASGEASNATGVNGDGSNNSASGSGAAYVFVRSGTTWSQQAYLKASNSGASDYFGYSVAMSGVTVVVGAINEASSTTGVNSAPNDSANGTGASYVFVRNGTTWSQQAYLKAGNSGAFDRFGCSVAVSSDTVVVGAYSEASNATGVNGDGTNNSASSAGAAYVFVRSGATWSQQAYLKAGNTRSDDQFGVLVAVSGDTVVVGAEGEDSNATGVNGVETHHSETSSGAAYVFVRSGTTWSQQTYLKASNSKYNWYFGHSVAVSGATVVAGAPGELSSTKGVNSTPNYSADYSGAVYVFDLNATTPPPEIAIEQAATGIASGGTKVFGTVAAGSTTDLTFTIKNTGTGDLNLTGAPKVAVTGSSDFTVTAQPASPITGPSGSTSFTVRFSPGSLGGITAAIHIANNDADENPYDINLSGTGATALTVFNDVIAASSSLTGSNALPTAIPFGDGVKNLLKYAFNMNLAGPDSSSLVAGTGTAGLPAFALVGSGAATQIRMEFLRRKGSGLIYTAKHSTSLTAFAPMTGTTTVTSINDQWERVLVQEPCNPATTPRCFGIVEVSLP